MKGESIVGERGKIRGGKGESVEVEVGVSQAVSEDTRCRTPIGSNEGSGSHGTHTNDSNRPTARLDADNK